MNGYTQDAMYMSLCMFCKKHLERVVRSSGPRSVERSKERTSSLGKKVRG